MSLRLLLLAIPLALGGALLWPGSTLAHGLGLAGLALGAAGLAFAQRSQREALRRAERAWHLGRPLEEVQALLPAGTGFGLAALLTARLRTQVLLASGQVEAAWQAGWEAQRLDLPLLARPQLLRCLRRLGQEEPRALLPSVLALAGRHPEAGRLAHLAAVLAFRTQDPALADTAWSQLERAWENSADDPQVLDDILRCCVSALQSEGLPEATTTRAGQLFDQTFDTLMRRHGDPRIPWDRQRAGHYLLQLGELEDALAVARHLPPATQGPSLAALEARCLRELGDAEGALAATDDGLTHSPGAFELLMERHAALLALGRDPEALEALEAAGRGLAAHPDTAEATFQWQVRRAEYAYWVEAQPGQAMALLQQVPPAYRPAGIPPLETELKVAMGQFDAATVELDALLKAHPGNLDLQLLLADCMAGMSAWEALVPFLEALPPEAQSRAPFWHLQGLAHSHCGRPQPGREALERATQLDPRNMDILLDLGHACMDLADWDRAAQCWRQVLALDPGNEEALIELSETRRLVHDREGAIRFLRECLLHHPDSTRAQHYLAEYEAN